jgi:hypothetical protein
MLSSKPGHQRRQRKHPRKAGRDPCPKYSQTLAVPVVAMVSRVVVATVVPTADINDRRRGIGGVRLIDHGRRPEVDAEIYPRTCDRGYAKREGPENKTNQPLFHGQSLE